MGKGLGAMSDSFLTSASGFILAGGASSRMGTDKALLELGGVPLLVRAARLVESLLGSATVIGPPEKYARLWPRVVADQTAGLGPVGGLVTALAISTSKWNLILACDLPYLTLAWLRYLLGRAEQSTADVVLPFSADSAGRLHPEPLCAVYHRRCLLPVRRAIQAGVRKMTDALKGCTVEAVEAAAWKPFDSYGGLFKNINSPDDYAEVQARWERSAAQ
ncbi:MAG: molybdenum cofactor guanylyltransferase [Firmicutes bacterium]|nr:molybdenum cofactor guanylyltransferase [Bacillota bacterium]